MVSLVRLRSKRGVGLTKGPSIYYVTPAPGGGRAHCFYMEVKVAVLNAISQNYKFFEVKLIPYASLCLENYLDQFFGKF